MSQGVGGLQVRTHRVEEHDSNGVIGAHKHLSLLYLHRGLESHKEVARLDVFVAWVFVHFEHGGSTVDAEEDDILLSFKEL